MINLAIVQSFRSKAGEDRRPDAARHGLAAKTGSPASDEAKLGGSCRRTLSRRPAVHRKLSQALRSDTFRYTSHALLMPREIAAVAQKVIIRVDAN
jgi:hypothetical protein